MRTLDDVHLSIPEGWGNQEDWLAGFEEVEAVEKPLVRLEAELSAQLDTIRGLGPSPALLGWLALWNRTFHVLEGLRGAITRRSLQTCRILERVSFETALHLMVIVEPLAKPGAIRLPRELKRSSVRGRMEAYLAWCLWRDLKGWKEFARPGRLRALYDPQPARRFVAEHQTLLDQLSPLLGEWETLTDAEAERERDEAERFARSRVALLVGWLSDDRIVDWYGQLERDEPGTFFEFLDADEYSMSRVVRGRGLRGAYGIYARGSAAIHGSSFEGGLFFSPPVVGPEIWADDETLSAAVEGGLTWARSSFLALSLTRPIDSTESW